MQGDWVVGAGKWRNPDEDLPQDFAERREENYRELRKPLDAADFGDMHRVRIGCVLADQVDLRHAHRAR